MKYSVKYVILHLSISRMPFRRLLVTRLEHYSGGVVQKGRLSGQEHTEAQVHWVVTTVK